MILEERIKTDCFQQYLEIFIPRYVDMIMLARQQLRCVFLKPL